MTASNLAFPEGLGSGDDSFMGLIELANTHYPGFIELVLDGGAGVGSFVDKVVKTSSTCKVIAFEPLPENAKVLRSRFAGLPAVDVRAVALGAISTAVPSRCQDGTEFQIAFGRLVPATMVT
jgi:hypothetical protein